MSSVAAALEHVTSWPRLVSSPRQIRTYQLRQLRRLVRHAEQRVPYYAQRFAHSGVSPGDIQRLDDLRKLPVSDKQDYQDSPIEDRFASGVRSKDCRLYETSGSTGQQMVVARTPKEDLRLFGRAAAIAGLEWTPALASSAPDGSQSASTSESQARDFPNFKRRPRLTTERNAQRG